MLTHGRPFLPARWLQTAIAVFFIIAIHLHKAEAASMPPETVLQKWYTLSLALIRHTPTYSPPVASRALAYLGVTAYEAVASGSPKLQSLAGQLQELKPLPPREAGKAYDEVVVLDAALAAMMHDLFSNTGPSGQQAIRHLEEELKNKAVSTDSTPETIARSEAYGQAIAAHLAAWSHEDGGAVIENMGFPWSYELNKGPEHWAPTNPLARQQQVPLLPEW
ncbi:MAG: phosphoesterase PA-phosphatase, partial [Alphaproteobacteria bacterium]|nr:phosphoesterase PA-phosphatase [Alphaproteobacteria bacterium]